MNIKTETIESIEEVTENDVARYDGENFLVAVAYPDGDIWTECESILNFSECVVIRLTVELEK